MTVLNPLDHSTSAYPGSLVQVGLVHRDLHGHRLLHPTDPLYINAKSKDNGHTPEEVQAAVYLVAFFGVTIIVLTIFLQQCNFILDRLGIQVQVHLPSCLCFPQLLTR